MAVWKCYPATILPGNNCAGASLFSVSIAICAQAFRRRSAVVEEKRGPGAEGTGCSTVRGVCPPQAGVSLPKMQSRNVKREELAPVRNGGEGAGAVSNRGNEAWF